MAFQCLDNKYCPFGSSHAWFSLLIHSPHTLLQSWNHEKCVVSEYWRAVTISYHMAKAVSANVMRFSNVNHFFFSLLTHKTSGTRLKEIWSYLFYGSGGGEASFCPNDFYSFIYLQSSDHYIHTDLHSKHVLFLSLALKKCNLIQETCLQHVILFSVVTVDWNVDGQLTWGWHPFIGQLIELLIKNLTWE